MDWFVGATFSGGANFSMVVCGSFQVKAIDSLPNAQTNLEDWFNNMTVDELDALLVTLLMSLLFIVYVRQRHRREFQAAAAAAPFPVVPPQ